MAIDHMIINCNKYDRAIDFYSWLLPKIGYPKSVSHPGTTGWFGSSGSFWIRQSDPRFKQEAFDRHRVGLCEIAFVAESREQINQLAKELEAHGGAILDPPQEYAYLPGYYALFFADPDGLKLELVNVKRG